MKAELSQVLPHNAHTAPRASSTAASSASRWLARLFFLAEHAPLMLRLLRVPLSRLVVRLSRDVRNATSANAGRIYGSEVTPGQRAAFAARVVESFLLFCHDVGRSSRLSPDAILSRIEQVEGHEHFVRARAMRRGAIVLTAHMGSFEVGMAALRGQGERCVHVVFQRDAFGRFERMRAALRDKLGVLETPVDEGWTIWMRLRDALSRDEVVVLQGDRVMPGQKGLCVPVLGAGMILPSGPAKLSIATGAPIVPVFALRAPGGSVRLCVEPAIVAGSVDDAMGRIADVIGKYVRRYPEQWLMLQPAWCDDAQ